MAKAPMLLYEFEDAPEELRALSPYGGDEDGLLVVPAGQDLPWWAERLWEHGDRPEGGSLIPDGRSVWIWSHA